MRQFCSSVTYRCETGENALELSLVYNMTLTTLATLAGTLAKTLAKTLGRCQNAAGDAVPFTIPLDERHLGVTETLRACSPPSYYMDRKDLLLLLLVYRRRTRRAREASRRRRRKWVRTIFQRRREHGDYHNLLAEMRLQDAESHYRFLRMSRETFDALVAKVAPALKRRSYQSVYRPEISPGERYSCVHSSFITVCVWVCVCLFVCMSACLPVSLSICLSVCLFVDLSVKQIFESRVQANS